jgi:tetratricopeptide (TPR) repeat protein
MSKLAFACIVKGTDAEAEVLNNLLWTVAPHVDGVFVTITQPNEKVKKVAELYNAHISHFDWCNDFAKARNFNFAQVPKDYDYILWGDADDEFQNVALLKDFIEKNKADAYVIQYYYDFDKYNMPTVVHPKTQVVANDGTFTWVGQIHEDLQANRDINLLRLDGITRMHRTTKERVKESAVRNLNISKENMTGDPRDYWNLANGYTGAGMYHDAIDTFKHFITVSGSDMEIYMATLRIASMFLSLGDLIQAEEYARKAIGLRYDYPDAFHCLAQVEKAQGKKKEAVKTTLEGISKKPPVDTAMVYNPRDYDYNPMMTLAHLYWDLAEFENARVCLEACAEIQPGNRDLDIMIKEADKEDRLQKKVIETAKQMVDMTDEEYTKTYDALTDEEKEHPVMMQSKNLRFVKKESSGKDIVYYCGQTTEWTPAILEKGIGGSEEAVINLSKEWAKLGYNVTVYNNCGDGGVFDGVTYKPWYTFNYRDKQDIIVLWRQAKPLDYDLNATKIFVDVHDVMQPGEFTEKRLKKITKVFLKSEAHRELFSNIPDDKVVIVPNGMDTKLFEEEVERDPYLIINTSSPDRALSALVRIFPKIKAKEPRAKMKWAYGFDIFDLLRSKDKEAMAWKKVMLRKMEEAGIENLGKISHKEVAKLTKSAGVMLYPTHFMEIDCVSARKAQLGGAHVVCSDFGALKTTVKYGYKVPIPYTKDNWCPPYSLDMADDPERDDEYVEGVLKAFELNDREQMQAWAKSFTPDYVAKEWEKVWLV